MPPRRQTWPRSRLYAIWYQRVRVYRAANFTDEAQTLNLVEDIHKAEVYEEVCARVDKHWRVRVRIPHQQRFFLCPLSPTREAAVLHWLSPCACVVRLARLWPMRHVRFRRPERLSMFLRFLNEDGVACSSGPTKRSVFRYPGTSSS